MNDDKLINAFNNLDALLKDLKTNISKSKKARRKSKMPLPISEQLRIDKLTCFKHLVKERKDTLEYKTDKKNTSDKHCYDCAFFEPLSPYMNRCLLITLDSEHRTGSINLNSCCKEWMKCVDITRENNKLKQYPSIELDNIYPEDVLKFQQRELNDKQSKLRE